MSEPSVLTYARYFDLTQDHTLYEPLAALDSTPAQPKDTTISPTSNESVESLIKGFEIAARDYVSLANDDLLPIPQDVARYLQSCTSHTIHDMSQVYDRVLPDPYRLRKLKLDLPLLVLGGGDGERDARKIRKCIDLQNMIDDFLDIEVDERDYVRRYEPPTSSTLSTEVLEWSKTQLQAAMKEEKLDVSMATMKYIHKTLSMSIEPVDVSTMLLNLTPKTASSDPLDNYSITEDCFQFEIETDVPSPSDLPKPDEHDKKEISSSTKRELDDLSRSDATTEEECFLQSTQADREMDELFRQFTHHDSDEQGKVTVNEATDRNLMELPTAKKRKLVHEINNETVPQNVGEDHVRDQKVELEDLKVKTPDILGPVCFEPPILDLPVIFGQCDEKNESFGETLPSPGPPPFRIPTLQEALRDSMPTQTKVAEKFVVEDKAIMSSDMLLYKEPGLRALDHDDAEDEHIVVDDYQIEEWGPETFLSIQPDYAKRPPSPCLFEGFGHEADKIGISHEHKKHEVKTTSVTIKREPAERVRIKQEFRPADIEEPIIRSPAISVNPFPQSGAPLLFELDGLSSRIAGNRAAGSLDGVQKLTDSSRLSDERERKSTTVECDLDLKSLLPKAKRKQHAQHIAMKNESILNDSLSSFLDLRGKQFKLPAVKGICKTAEVIDDPIISSQDFFAKDWYSDEHTLIPSPTQPVEPVQQELIPPTMPLDEPRTIVVNSTLLQSKPLLVQFLDSPDTTNLTLIYRDMDVKQYPGPDLVLNTTTCLFVTNLQSLNQRPLPGQNSATGLSSTHDRVANLIRSYLRVIVLVHHTTSIDSATQSKILSTQASFAAFNQNFARESLSDRRQIQPYWVPCVNPASTSNVVNAWVWQVINRCAYRNGSPKSPRPSCLARPILIRDETLWEVFLCKAGLNPFAAQVVISSLRRSGVQSRMGVDEEASWGLRRLVAMGSQERTKMFGTLVGVDIVERLNKVLFRRDESEYRT